MEMVVVGEAGDGDDDMMAAIEMLCFSRKGNETEMSIIVCGLRTTLVRVVAPRSNHHHVVHVMGAHSQLFLHSLKDSRTTSISIS